ncbi:MAG TPA: hypothetical protein VN706_18545 [Gemmatimonadaceae bacterium]|nr:hypothetical protein [Gemmatimonadaceae bacterium]
MRRILLGAALAGMAAAPSLLAAQTFKTEKFNIGGEGAFDYVAVDPSSGNVYVSRGTHMMVVDGATGKVLHDILDTPRVHGAAFSVKDNHGFTTNGGDSTSTMFDPKTFDVIKKIHAGKDGLDGIMYDDATDKILTINHSKPIGSTIVIDAKTGDVVTTIELSGKGPEGGVSNGKDRIFINNEDNKQIDVIDSKTWKVIGHYATCEGATGIAMDRAANRIFSACDDESLVLDASNGNIVARIKNGGSVDALGWDQSQKLMYIPSGDGNVTVVHEDSPDKYTVIATVQTMRGARTIGVDTKSHAAYVFTPEYGPPPAGATPPANGRGRGPRGPIIGAWLIKITH